MWNAKNLRYIQLSNTRGAVCIKYENLLADPLSVIEGIAVAMDLQFSRENFNNVVTSAKGDQDKNYDYYQRYYLEELWKKDLTENCIKLINSRLDRSVMTYFRYDML